MYVRKNQKNSEILLNKNNKCLFSYLYIYIYKVMSNVSLSE